VRSS
ncbi:GAF domain protein, partial [Vibrio parahaemolyticus VP2007-007]|jgi:hypothetical protein